MSRVPVRETGLDIHSICGVGNIIPDDILIQEGHNILHCGLILLLQVEDGTECTILFQYA